jgi:hypothetical protein
MSKRKTPAKKRDWGAPDYEVQYNSLIGLVTSSMLEYPNPLAELDHFALNCRTELLARMGKVDSNRQLH